jgi:hypothetical protein
MVVFMAIRVVECALSPSTSYSYCTNAIMSLSLYLIFVMIGNNEMKLRNDYYTMLFVFVSIEGALPMPSYI